MAKSYLQAQGQQPHKKLLFLKDTFFKRFFKNIYYIR
jgi:hypothetical protein